MFDIKRAKPCDIVAFTAHPDDVELNCAGTLALAVKSGRTAGVVDFCRGELGTRGTPEIRDAEAAAAAKALGLTCRINLELGDGHLRDNDETRRLVVEVLRRMRPRVVIAPPLVDHHPDHVAVGEILSRTVYLAGVAKYAPGGEPLRPHALLHYVGSQIVTPKIVVDVTPVWQERMDATLCFRSQFYREGSSEGSTRIAHPEFLSAIEGRARHFGSTIGATFGEAYTSPEPVPARDVVRLYSEEPWRPVDGEG